MARLDGKIVVVANRGPNDFVWTDGGWVTRSATGGLVSMLTPLARQPNVAWFCCVSEPPDAEQARQGLFTTAADQTDPRLHVVPVPLPADVYQAYYGRVSNEVLWMLQHHLVGPGGYEMVDQHRHRAWEAGYLAANRQLAAAIARTCSRPVAFLVQDYHLYPLPALLREAFPRTPVVHFTHIPFPEPPSLQLLPAAWRVEVLRGLLAADVVGLQTAGDVRAFLSCAATFLNAEVDWRERTVRGEGGRLVKVRAYPASVDPAALHRLMRSRSVSVARSRVASHLAPLNVIRVDRLDPSKNQLVGFLAFERLLELRPDLQGRVRFLAFLVPSRTDLGVYRQYRDAIYRQIARINERFGARVEVANAPTTGAGGETAPARAGGPVPPIEVFYTNDRDQALAAMAECDVLLANSLRDGMNLVVKECAVVSRRPAVLVLSETAGVAEETADSALQVSPLDVEGTARALAQALDMPLEERAARLARFRQRIEGWTAWNWLAAQFCDLGIPLDADGREEPASQGRGRAASFSFARRRAAGSGDSRSAD